MMYSLKLLLSLLPLALGCIPLVLSSACNLNNFTRESGRCTWYGMCADSPYIAGGRLPCYDNNPARDINSLGTGFVELLKETCPRIAAERGLACCDYSQLVELATQMKFPRQLFGRCPACIRNFIDHFCFVTCSPDQSLYSTPEDCTDGDGKATMAITSIAFYLSDKYAKSLYRSCSDVQYPQGDTNVVDLMCGGRDSCSSTKWLNYLSNPIQNHISPFPIHYHYDHPTSSIPPGAHVKNETFIIPCNTSYPQYRCSCDDCKTPDLCPLPPRPPYPPSKRIIVTPKSNTYSFEFQPVGVYGAGNWTFGPALDNEVLLELLEVQDYLNYARYTGTLGNGTDVVVTLSDICHKPLAPANANCTIWSVLNYFQNSKENLLYTEEFGLINNSYHIYYCIRDPTSSKNPLYSSRQMSCLGAFGGPVLPIFAFEGFNFLPNGKPNFQNATRLVVSIPVQDNQLAKIWEKGFQEYIKLYLGKYIDISYSAESAF